MAEKTVATRSQQRTPPSREETRSQEQYVAPPVDIYETAEGLVVKADLPGVAKENLDVPRGKQPAHHPRKLGPCSARGANLSGIGVGEFLSAI